MLVNPNIQTTATLWPNQQKLKDQLSFPLVLSLQPMAHDHVQSSISPDKISHFRCQSCKAFINQLCFIRNQHEYDCPLCGSTNRLPNQIDIRMPQLNHMSYRIKAPPKQRLLQTKERLVIFILDLAVHTQQARDCLLYKIQLIRSFIKTSAQGGLPLKMMIVGFDDRLFRFVIDPEQGQPEVYISKQFIQQDQAYFPNNQTLIGDVYKVKENVYQLLNELEQTIKTAPVRNSKSQGLLQALKLSLTAGQSYSGKLFLFSGMIKPLASFIQNLQKHGDTPARYSYITNKKQCIPVDLQQLLQHTQISLSFMFINNHHINLMPFHYMAKTTNGQLRHYFPNQQTLFFYQLKNKLEELMDPSTGYQTVMKVRSSTGIKLVGTFGAYRQTRIPDQVDLLTCSSDRKYLFQYLVQGKITSQFVVVQFSTIFTTLSGQRCFIIQTHLNKVSGDPQNVISSINYANINVAYVRGITHKLDFVANTRVMQVNLQERAKLHYKAIRALQKQPKDDIENPRELVQGLTKKMKPYLVLSFLMMKHFILNHRNNNPVFYDLNAAMRSKIATHESAQAIIWPTLYAVSEQGWQIIQMQGKNLQKGTVALLIDRGDQYYCSLTHPKYQPYLRLPDAKRQFQEFIQKGKGLEMLRLLIGQIKSTKETPYLDIIPLGDLNELSILNMEGTFGFGGFINEMISH